MQLLPFVLVWLHASADAQVLHDSCLEVLFCFFFSPPACLVKFESRKVNLQV